MIMRTAMMQIWDWVEGEDLGTWQRSGAGQAWSTWRHKFMTHQVVVHDSFEARAAEEASTTTGRCEAWRHGDQEGGPWFEWDLPLAYARICAETLLPSTYVGWIKRVHGASVFAAHEGERRLWHLEVETEQPVLPVRHEDGILWPVGRFSGWWWDHELTELERASTIVEAIECHVYRATPALKAWAEWCIRIVEDPAESETPAIQAAVKHMSRAIVGRFAARYRVWEPFGDTPDEEIALVPVWDHDAGIPGELLMLHHEAWWSDHRELGRDACPAIQSAIMAECRIRLWRCMQAAGLEVICYVDTDGLIVNYRGNNNLLAMKDEQALWGLRQKRTITELRVDGPRQLLVDGQLRYAGIPKRSRHIEGQSWADERFESLEQSLKRGSPTSVSVAPWVWQAVGVDRRRVHLADGSTETRRVG